MAAAEQPISRFHARGPLSEVVSVIAGTQPEKESLTVVFLSPDYDPAEFGTALHEAGVRRAVGAVTSRVIGSLGVEASGVAGFHLPQGRFAVAYGLLENAASSGLPAVREEVRRLRAALDSSGGDGHLFAMLLVDATARCEERLVALIGMELNGIPLVGGSAGDSYFNLVPAARVERPILHGGRAHKGAAVLCLVRSATPLAAYCHHHYLPTLQRIVITDADPARRLVRAIDGRRALDVYAEKCGCRTPPRDVLDLAPYPLMIRIGGQYYTRGPQRIFADGSIEFACAIEPGLVAAVGQPGDMVASLAGLFESMQSRIGRPELVIGADCAARTAYMERRELTTEVTALFERNHVAGFASLGEQFNTIHVNNSFTCLGLAAPR